MGKTAPPPQAAAQATVHPHVRGEDPLPRWMAFIASGSPPRTWGRLVVRVIVVGDVRFTPTYVGKTRRRCPGRGQAPVHPHVRGEDGQPTPLDDATFGSPPRTWGRPGRHIAATDLWRFTPTYVGKTYRGTGDRPRPAVHPHVRGEDAAADAYPAFDDGSPPRTWGRPVNCSIFTETSRFTPTYVGKTGTGPRRERRPPVHPHVRGEDRFLLRRWRQQRGSPPRTWGRLRDAPRLPGAARFTPTYVGKTPGSEREPGLPAVHPHVRGEDSTSRYPPESNCGSPPRTWGRHGVLCVFTGALPVHPHVRGEDQTCPQRPHSICGSPPRTWGRRSESGVLHGGVRFTPTYVGKTAPPRAAWRSRSVHPHVRGEDVRSSGAAATARRFTPTYVGKTSGGCPGTVLRAVHPHVRGEDSCIR